MFPITTKLSGVTFSDAQANVRTFGCEDIGSYELVREPDNPHDPNAIKVQVAGHFLGYVPSKIARWVAPLIDEGKKLRAEFVRRNESPYHETVGLTVRIVEVVGPGTAGAIRSLGGERRDLT